MRAMGHRTVQTASLALAAGFGRRVRTVDADYTLTVEDDQVLLVDTSSEAITVTLPPAAEAFRRGAGSEYVIRCLSATEDVTVDGAGAETINGAATLTISGATAAQRLITDGTAWYTL